VRRAAYCLKSEIHQKDFRSKLVKKKSIASRNSPLGVKVYLTRGHTEVGSLKRVLIGGFGAGIIPLRNGFKIRDELKEPGKKKKKAIGGRRKAQPGANQKKHSACEGKGRPRQ